MMSFMKSLKVQVTWSSIWTVSLAERRIFPAIDIRRSGTRREEVLLSKEELDTIWAIRKNMNDSYDFVEGFLKKLRDSKTNA